MNNLNPVDFRDNYRRTEERRVVSRRLISHPFGSKKWIKALQKSYLMWPKEDRRLQDRRYASRRMAERRTHIDQTRRRTTQQRTLHEYIQKPLLTTEEISMLKELTRCL